jgi:tetratricopeptide (TPR) repeat protein
LALGRTQDALADLDELGRGQPDSAAFLELRREIHERLGQNQAAPADRERAAGLLPPSARQLNNAAWELVTSAVYLRDPERAVNLARKAVAAAPDSAIYLNTLGVALYRAGRPAQAIAALEQSLAATNGQIAAVDLFFLAMARHRLGHTVQAREAFDRAVRWWREQKQLRDDYAQELAEFRAEAEAVLSLPRPIGELPADVFAPAPPDQP